MSRPAATRCCRLAARSCKIAGDLIRPKPITTCNCENWHVHGCMNVMKMMGFPHHSAEVEPDAQARCYVECNNMQEFITSQWTHTWQVECALTTGTFSLNAHGGNGRVACGKRLCWDSLVVFRLDTPTAGHVALSCSHSHLLRKPNLLYGAASHLVNHSSTDDCKGWPGAQRCKERHIRHELRMPKRGSVEFMPYGVRYGNTKTMNMAWAIMRNCIPLAQQSCLDDLHHSYHNAWAYLHMKLGVCLFCQ